MAAGYDGASCHGSAAVWADTSGGYPVLKKWLRYREQGLLGRSLRPEEVREFTAIARRIAAIILLGPALDGNDAAVKAAAGGGSGGGRRA